ncbi:hypothetical protein [Streptomyces sp. JJ36]|uniref:hypothetical protein n=1 Tax=Streptomyces sp. JJ36 TaxID=2736645 RepID=UPI001F182B08|nr:hypothetical protein [Streptomyces sp. JJ36]MCF6523839.1 hypothetical protein [Streptomyces sp. JJ36]
MPGAVPVLLLYSMFRSAYRRAHAVFARFRVRVEDHRVARIKRARAWTAALASAVFLGAYGAGQDVRDALAESALRLLIAPWLLIVTAPAVIVLLVRLAPAERRPAMRSGLRGPLTSLAQYVGALTLVPLLAWSTALPQHLVANEDLAVLLSLVLLVPVLWAVFFAVSASMVVVRTGFGTGEVHAALPALLTCLTVWEFVPVSLLVGGLPPGPGALPLLLLFGGPVTLTGVVWWEVHRLQTRHGVTLRG